jgi:hypothetical protein
MESVSKIIKGENVDSHNRGRANKHRVIPELSLVPKRGRGAPTRISMRRGRYIPSL